MMKKKWLTLSTGFALFSMFFGSGNLVFPISVGQQSQGHYLLASIGILMTGVLVPFLGVFGMSLYAGNFQSFFSSFGKRGTFWFSLCALSLMGPFGVLARCLTVAHGALQLIIPHAPLTAVSLVLCLVIYLLTINKNKILTLIGIVLTPFLLLSIATITFLAFKQDVLLEPIHHLGGWEAIKNGFLQGYQTMDLLAAFFFSTFVIQQLQRTCTDPNESSLKVFTKASLVGASILSLVYFALVLLGWIYAPLLTHHLPQEMLGAIAMKTLGPLAAPCVCLAVILACLTTAIVLASLFADFLRQEVFKNRIGNKQALIATLGISFFISTLEFAGISKFLGPILEMIYPALIILTIINIIYKVGGFKFFWGLEKTPSNILKD